MKDSQEYDFEPANIVLNISRIYVNLSDSDAFCLAVSQDGRSYSQQLFVQAEDVLGNKYKFNRYIRIFMLSNFMIDAYFIKVN